ncbi:hypothetical protein AK812_SmicGene17325 [Symbiodinium microadriaticum]|uniref:Uncharacterized protein n=1 Tax=Symbiodinium microadriaticum TaxID=2951 RepID=A0A1Q9DY21_SYMMI|nr:hypothetical protein AK812_SmicGene17325 [Symbiodinium microadriaticum]
MQAATAKVALPRTLQPLLTALRSRAPSPTPPFREAVSESVQKWLSTWLLQAVGFPRNYWQSDATQGAEAAIRHLSESRNAAQSPMVEAKLREVFSEAMSGLDEAKLELAWNLDVSSVDLRNFLLIYGMRRSTGSRTTGLYRKQVSGHYVVSKEPTPAGPWEVAQAALEGGIVCADFVLTCEQVLELRCVETQEIKLHEESTVDHRLRLEAEWTAAQGDDREIPPIFDEERGWLITDLNGAADLNSPVAHLEEVE